MTEPRRSHESTTVVRKGDPPTLNAVETADRFWQKAEALLARTEELARLCATPESFDDDLVRDIRHISGAVAVRLRLVDGQQHELLAGVGVVTDQTDTSPARKPAQDQTPSSTWILNEGSGVETLSVRYQLEPSLALVLDAEFAGQMDVLLRKPVDELCCALLEIAALVHARQGLASARRTLVAMADRDRAIANLHRGPTAAEHFHWIAKTLAVEVGVDRVNLLACRNRSCRLIASSSQRNLDGGARQVRTIERLVRGALLEPQDWPGKAADELDAYRAESGVTELHFETIDGKADQSPLAVLVFESFSADQEHAFAPESRFALRWAVWRELASQAIVTSLERDAATGSRLGKWLADPSRRAARIALMVVGLFAFAGLWLPVPLRIPIQGVVTPRVQARIYAPASGAVSTIHVSSGQAVTSGQPLVKIHDSEIERAYQALASELATARTKLDSLSAMRSVEPGRRASADEQVLETQIRGLQAQLAVVETEMAGLDLAAPIDGIVDHWDLQQSLIDRPVVRGQYLFRIIAADSGWDLNLELPDHLVGYLQEAQRSGEVACDFRLRSEPSQTYAGVVRRIANQADINADGRSVVRVIVPWDAGIGNAGIGDSGSRSVRAGATVIGHLHCGNRPAAFVYLRGIIQWYRGQTWY